VANTISISVKFLAQGRPAEAFKLLASLRSREAAVPPQLLPALYFNFALCLAEDYPAAVAELEKALESLRRLNPSQASVPPPGVGTAAGFAPGTAGLVAAVPSPEYTAKWQKLRGDELCGGAYTRPFPADYPLRFPREAREDITAALADACERCGLADKAHSLRAGLSGPEFEAYKKQRL
jgi:hypothetical protein